VNEQVRVSVVVPVFNTVPYLPACLDSILTQSVRDIEVLCVDDGSTDGSLAVLHDRARRDPRVVVLEQRDGKTGPGSARNLAIDRARGEFVACIDSDDHIHPDMFRLMLAEADRDRTDVVICRIAKFSDSGAKEKFARDTYDRNIPPELDGTAFTWRDLDDVFSLRFASCNKLYRRDFLDRHGIRYAEGIFYEDMIFTFRSLLLAPRLRFVREDLYFNRRQREGATTFVQSDRVIGALTAMDQVEELLQSDEELRGLLQRFVAFKFTKLTEYLHKNDPEHMPPFYEALQRFAADPRLDDNPYLSEDDQQKREMLLSCELTRFLVWEIWDVKTKNARLRRERAALRARNRRLRSRKIFRIERKIRELQQRVKQRLRPAADEDPHGGPVPLS
jgi:glycosyltransferase involved in cell wall biosynthesis